MGNIIFVAFYIVTFFLTKITLPMLKLDTNVGVLENVRNATFVPFIAWLNTQYVKCRHNSN